MEKIIEEICIETYNCASDISAFALLERMMQIPNMPMHCPAHHYMIPAVLLTVMAKKTDISEAKFKRMLTTARDRANKVLGGFCGWYGNCGAAVGVGIFMSVYTNCGPKSEKYWADCNRATGNALLSIARINGPRCCKRNCFIAMESAINTIKDVFGVELAGPVDHKCSYYEQNAECKKGECPFYPL